MVVLKEEEKKRRRRKVVGRGQKVSLCSWLIGWLVNMDGMEWDKMIREKGRGREIKTSIYRVIYNDSLSPLTCCLHVYGIWCTISEVSN